MEKTFLDYSHLHSCLAPQRLELPMSRTNFHGPKDVRAIEVRLYLFIYLLFYFFI